MNVLIKLRVVQVCVWIVLAGGCKNNTSEFVPSFNLDELTDGTELKLTDLVEDIRIIPLETNDSLRLKTQYGGGYRIAVTDNYILSLGDDGVILFDMKDGQYIRKITSGGRGPMEHGLIYSTAVDEKKKLLYIAHMNASGKLVVNLETGESYTIPDSTRYGVRDLFCVLPDGAICADYMNGMFCRIDPVSGGILPMVSPEKQLLLQTVQKEKGQHTGTSLRLHKEKIYIFNQRYSDTLYHYHTSGDLTNVLALRTNDIHSENDKTKIVIPYVGDENILCIKYNIQVHKDMENGILKSFSIINRPGHLFCFSTGDGFMKKVSKFIFNPLFVIEQEGKEAAGFFITGTFTNRTYYAKIMDAYQVKEAIQSTLGDVGLSKDKVRKLRELDSRLHEEDNPVVIIGKKR